jgi:hypothetical protein
MDSRVRPKIKQEEEGDSLRAAHTENNAVFLFLPFKSPIPHHELFAKCNTLRNISAHASAQDVFSPSPPALATQTPEVRVTQQVVKIIRPDDEEGFNEMTGSVQETWKWVTMAGWCYREPDD